MSLVCAVLPIENTMRAPREVPGVINRSMGVYLLPYLTHHAWPSAQPRRRRRAQRREGHLFKA